MSKKDDKGFIAWFRQYKHITRPVLLSLCIIGMVFEVIAIQGYVKEISSPDFNLDDYVPRQFNTDFDSGSSETYNLTKEELEKIMNNENTYKELMKDNVVTVPYNPISKAIWSLVNLNFYLFLISLLWWEKKE